MRIDAYDWAGGREAMLRFGLDTGSVLVVAMPLLEEWNRTRAFVVTLCRGLADRGIASVLPDLPGHGESLVQVADLTMLRIAEALEALADRLGAEGRAPFGLAVRSGALVDHRARLHGRWHLAPVTGEAVLRDLHRTWLATGPDSRQRSREAMIYGQDTVTIAGQALSAPFLSSLVSAEPFDQPGVPRRTVRLASDPRPADLQVEGPPLWRRFEPGNDIALARSLADDIASWITSCAA